MDQENNWYILKCFKKVWSAKCDDVSNAIQLENLLNLALISLAVNEDWF